MSLLFIDSFDHYFALVDKWDSFTSSAPQTVVGQGRFTPGAYHMTGFEETTAGAGSVTKSLVTASFEGIFGFAFKYSASPAADEFEFKDDGGLIIGGIKISGNDILLTDKDGNTVATASTALSVDVWQFIEVRVKSSATIGEIEVHVSGSSVASAVNQNTRGTVIGDFQMNHISETDDAWVDDLYVLDTLGTSNNTFLGDTRITVLRPKANGLDNDFTPTGAASNFQAVDDVLHDQDATFVEAGQIGAKETYDNVNFTDLGISPGTIFGVQVVNATKKTDAGQLKYKDQMIIGGLPFDNGLDAAIATSGAYKMTRFISDTDPSDDATWTEAKVDAVGSGLEITFREV